MTPAFCLKAAGLALLLTGALLACGEQREAPAALLAPDPGTSAPAATPAPPAPARPAPARPPPQAKSAPPAPKDVLGEAIALPDDYPADAPVYPGARAILSEETADGRLSVVFRSQDDGEAVNAYVREFLKSQGWKIDSELAMGEQFALDAVKQDRRIAVLTANNQQLGESLVTVLVSR